MTEKHKPRIGIALGSGSARGWAHIGALRELADMGIEADIVCGCSIGAVVGAAYAANNLERLEKLARSLGRLDMIRYFELNTSLNGFVRKDRLQKLFHHHMCAELQIIEGLSRKFASVATCLDTGREVWFTEGRVMDAVMASIALPGLFPPFPYEDRWVVDGGLVNPVPVSLCRALGADIVIAINLNGHVLNQRSQKKDRVARDKVPKDKDAGNAITVVASTEVSSGVGASVGNTLVSSMAASLRGYSSILFPGGAANGRGGDGQQVPSLMEAIAGSINIMQDKITRSRMAGDPPEILLNPKVGDISLLEFHRAADAIEAGHECVRRARSEIMELLNV